MCAGDAQQVEGRLVLSVREFVFFGRVWHVVRPGRAIRGVGVSERSGSGNQSIEFRIGLSLAGDGAMRAANQTVRFGGKIGNDALHRIASEVEHRLLVTLGIAIGVGILIGIAGAGVSAASRPTDRREAA